MDNDTNISHITILAASIEKMYNKARVNGRLRPTDLYLIEAVNKFLGGCISSLTHYQTQILFKLYNNLLSTSPDICRLINIVPSTIQKNSGFIQNSEIATPPGIYDRTFNTTFD